MKFDRDVPIPPVRREHFWAGIFRAMEVGDSFLMPPEREKQRGWLYQVAKNLGLRVRVRQTNQGLRVWRIS